MRRYSYVEHVCVPVSQAWLVLSDVEMWPSWTPTMDAVTILDGAWLTVGARVAIEQPGLRDATWTVTSYTPGCEFTWEARHPGVLVRAMHKLEPTANGCTFSQVLEFEGLLSGLIAFRLGSLTRQYMQEEAEGFRRRCEALSAMTRRDVEGNGKENHPSFRTV